MDTPTGKPGVGKGYADTDLSVEDVTTNSRSLGELVAGVTERFSRLIRDELQLAQLQAKAKAVKLGTGAALFIVAGVLALYALGFMLHGFVYLLAEWLPLWAGAFIVFGVLLLIILILVLVGMARLKASKKHVVDPKSGIQNSVSAVKKGLKNNE